MKKNRDEMRPISFEVNVTDQPMGSVIANFGKTKVFCTVMVEEGVPKFIESENDAWLTAEYAMLPGATVVRKKRRKIGGELDGRSVEIGRLIGRSLRAAINLKDLGHFTIYVDCDVLQADGGTRTAAISGAYLALKIAMHKLVERDIIIDNPLIRKMAAVSVGLVDGEPTLDLCFCEDSRAEVDMNIIMDDELNLVEIQGCAEKNVFSRDKLNEMLDLAEKGIKKIIEEQEKAFNESYFSY